MSASAKTFWSRRADGVELHLRLTPKSSRDALEGFETRADGACVLKARVRAVPEDGKANDALIALVSKQLKHPGLAHQTRGRRDRPPEDPVARRRPRGARGTVSGALARQPLKGARARKTWPKNAPLPRCVGIA